MPNPSFEEYSECPDGLAQIENLINWYSPTAGTSDYFNSCSSSSSGVNIPNSVLGFQVSDGNGFVGINLQIDPLGIDWLEYIQVKLNPKLKANVTYKLSFEVNLANTSHYALKKIGAWITPNSAYSSSTSLLFSNQPSIANETGYLSDTLNWQRIEGEYTANGDEEFLTIGCYSDTVYIDTLSILSGENSIFSYYYIDNVELLEKPVFFDLPNVFSPNNDGVNDVFTFIRKEGVSNYSISILNRWGNMVYSGENEFNWDGNSQNGIPMSDGTYFYILNYNEKEKKSGFVQLMR